jgi:hypothetical protein
MKIALYFLLIIVLTFSDRQAAGQTRTPGYDSDGMVMLSANRSFLLGLYQKPNMPNSFEYLAKTGFNLVNLPADGSMLDSAKVAGIWSWVTLGTIDPAHRAESWNNMRKTINNLKGKEALLAWELADEPAFNWNSSQLRIAPEIMIETHDSVKKQDSLHPIYLNHAPVNLVTTMQQYNRSNDFTACDIYPVIPAGIRLMYALNPDGIQGDLPNTTLSQVGDYVNKMRKVSGANKPLLMVLQGFAWEMLRPASERDSTKIRYPSYNESWFMAWDAIIHGANGLIWWGTAFTPAGHPFHAELNKVVNKLSSLHNVLSLPAKPFTLNVRYHECGHSVSKGIEVLVKKEKNQLWILTANTERYPVQADLLFTANSSIADVVFEERTIQIDKSGFTENYLPYEVHLYKLTLK